MHTFREVYGSIPTLQEFRQRLSSLDGVHVLLVCAALNALIRSDDDVLDFAAQNGAIRAYFPPPIAVKLISNKDSKPRRAVLNRQQLLFIAKEALLSGGTHAGTAPSNHEFGDLFLIANDVMQVENTGPSQGTEDSFVKLAVQMIAIQEAANDRVLHKMIRAHKMTSAACLDKLRNEAYFFDLPELFQEVSGISLTNYQALALASVSKFIEFNPQKYMEDPANYSLDKKWFASTAIPTDQIELFMQLISASPEALREAIGKSSGPNDVSHFRKFPMLDLNGRLHPIDVWILAEKFETGPFWAILGSLNKKQGDLFMSFWGKLFEEYMADLLMRSASTHNVVHVSPKFESGEEFCDVLILCGDSAVCIEAKGSTFKASAKYRGNADELRTEIETRFIKSSDRKQAVEQLAQNITAAFGPEGRKVKSIDLSYIKRVYPLLITRDDIGSVVGINAFLDIKFGPLVPRKQIPTSVAPLVCMSSDHAEMMSCYFDQIAFSEILSAHISANRKHQARYITMPVFSVPNKALLSICPPKEPQLKKEWGEVVLSASGVLKLPDTPENVTDTLMQEF